MPRKSIDILIAEDDPADVDLIKEVLTLHNGGLIVNISVVENGEDAMNFLHKKASFQEALRPDLVILDLNMPRKNGRQVLKEIKSHERFKNIPVVILTTSNAVEDIDLSYKLGANSYVTKADNLLDYQKNITALEEYWCKVASLPTK